jgi:hypothetical protein
MSNKDIKAKIHKNGQKKTIFQVFSTVAIKSQSHEILQRATEKVSKPIER